MDACPDLGGLWASCEQELESSFQELGQEHSNPYGQATDPCFLPDDFGPIASAGVTDFPQSVFDPFAAAQALPADLLKFGLSSDNLSALEPLPFTPCLPPASSAVGRLDIVNLESEDEFWFQQQRQQQQETSRKAPQIIESPFSASTVQQASMPFKPPQMQQLRRTASVAFEETSSLSAAAHLTHPALSYANSLVLDSHLSAPAPGLSYASDVTSQTFQCQPAYLQHSQSMTPNNYRCLDSEVAGDLCWPSHRTFVGAATDPALTNRAASTPVAGADVLAAELRRPTKRVRKVVAVTASASESGSGVMTASLSCPGSRALPESAASSHSGILLSMQPRGHCIRVVSGKGDFNFPAWKPHDNKPTQKVHCLRIRSNELNKPSRADSDSAEVDETRLGPSTSGSLYAASRQSVSGESTLATEPRRSARAAFRVGGSPGQEREGNSLLFAEGLQ